MIVSKSDGHLSAERKMPDFVPEFALVIVPDGCRREFEPNIEGIKIGHQLGLENIRNILTYARDLGIIHAVVWGSSESNLRERKSEEVAHLFQLFESELEHQFRSRDARIYVRGRWQKYAPDYGTYHRLKNLIERVEKVTEDIVDSHLTILWGYDGQMEIADAALDLKLNDEEGIELALCHDSTQNTWGILRDRCWTKHVPAGNLFIIRTGLDGDSHESDLLLPFQRQNAEYFTTPVCWPCFTKAHLDEALDDFSTRRRKKGK